MSQRRLGACHIPCAAALQLELTPVSRLCVSSTDADQLKGSATNAVASWGRGAVASLSALAGKEVALKVAMADAKLFSLRLGCAE